MALGTDDNFTFMYSFNILFQKRKVSDFHFNSPQRAQSSETPAIESMSFCYPCFSPIPQQKWFRSRSYISFPFKFRVKTYENYWTRLCNLALSKGNIGTLREADHWKPMPGIWTDPDPPTACDPESIAEVVRHLPCCPPRFRELLTFPHPQHELPLLCFQIRWSEGFLNSTHCSQPKATSCTSAAELSNYTLLRCIWDACLG